MLSSLRLVSTADVVFEHFSATGYYHHETEACFGYTTVAHDFLLAPCFAFDAILAILSLWTAVRHSKQHSRPPRLRKPQLVDVIIQGNVIYFLGCVLSCPYEEVLTSECSPLVTFMVYFTGDASFTRLISITLFRRAPIAICTGCRLILSIQEAASHHLTSGSHTVINTFVEGHELREENTYVI